MLIAIYECDFGEIQITIDKKVIIDMTMKKEDFKSIKFMQKTNDECTDEEKYLFNEVVQQLDEYFEGSREKFNLPLKFKKGTFRTKVYEAVMNTEYGKTYSYKDIAVMAGSPRAYRAVGSAMKNNPYAMVIPCHRVIKANGEYGRYFNDDNLKGKLIDFEK